MKKVVSLFLALVMTLVSIIPNVAFAKGEEESQENIEVEKLAFELRFYFEKVGHLDKNGDYQITNASSLRAKAYNGDEYAKTLLDSYYERQNRGAKDFAKCIAKDYFGVYIDLINGNLWNTFVNKIKSKAWNDVAKIILKVLGKSTAKANVIATAGQLAVAAYNCRGKW